MAERRSKLPVPAWLFAADGLSALLLGIGLYLRIEPPAGLTERLPWLLIFIGGAGLIACSVAAVRHLLAARTPSSR